MNDPFGGIFSFIKEIVRAKEPWLALFGDKVVLGFYGRENFWKCGGRDIPSIASYFFYEL